MNRPDRRPAGGGRAADPSGARPIVTMRDVARLTGVSQSTVSRVLSGAPTAVPIADDTRERVVTAARTLGYRPNPLARGLRGMPTMLLGVIVRDITDPFFAGAIEAVSLEAAVRGYNVVLGHAHGRADEAIALWGVLEARHCDAIVMLGDMSDQPRLVEDLRGTHIPVVALWEGSKPDGIASVSVDNEAGIRAVMDHLIGLGHRQIAFVGGRRLGDIREREEAYLAALDAIGAPVRDGYLQYATNDPSGGSRALAVLLELAERPTAVVASTDVIAMGVLFEANARGLSVPGDLSVTGFDDIPLAAFSIPTLTTLRMPTREMVGSAVGLLIDGHLDPADPGAWPRPIFAPELVIRTSTGPVPGA